MRISDWSSDVCSSDLPPLPGGLPESLMSIIEMAEAANPDVLANTYDELAAQRSVREVEGELLPSVELQGSVGYQIGRESGRVGVCPYVSISVVAVSLKKKTLDYTPKHTYKNKK